MNKNVKLLGMAAVVSMTFAACSNDELKEIYQHEGISFTTKVNTRATVTNLENFNGFHVYADAPGNSMFIEGELATKDSETGVYKLANNYVWPEGIDEVNFWAYGPENIINKDAIDLGTDAISFKHFEPNNDITNQKDLVVAYTRTQRRASVPLNFYHALSQIEVNARCVTANKNIKIKGAWIVNVTKAGKLAFSQSAVDTHYMNWTPSTDTKAKTNYGSSVSLNLGGNSSYSGLLAGNTNMMLIPQSIEPLLFTKKDTETVENNGGAYILLLCRVETQHLGQYNAIDHEGSTTTGAIKNVPGPEGSEGYHLHQQFPVQETYDDEAYGYTCVPLTKVTWIPGKKYVYNLDICGPTSGAGVYPPDEELPKVDGITPVERPDSKKPGDPVLDDPITFDVTIEEWVSEDNPENVIPTPMK